MKWCWGWQSNTIIPRSLTTSEHVTAPKENVSHYIKESAGGMNEVVPGLTVKQYPGPWRSLSIPMSLPCQMWVILLLDRSRWTRLVAHADTASPTTCRARWSVRQHTLFILADHVRPARPHTSLKIETQKVGWWSERILKRSSWFPTPPS